MSTRCKKVLSLQLLEQQGDALGAEEAEWLSEHLTTCAECRAESLVLSTLGEDRIEAHLLPMDELTRRRDQDAVLLRLAAKRQRLHETPSWKKRAVVGSGVLMVLAVVGLLLTVGRDVDPRSAHEEPTVETMTLKEPSGLQGFKTPQNVKTEFDSEDQMKTGKDRTTVTLAEGARVMLEPHTEIGLKRDSGGIAVAIRKGGLLASITPKNNRPRFRVDTPAGQVVVTGTIFSVNVSTDAVTVSVFRGRVSVERPKHGSVAVSAGETMRIDSVQQREMTAEETEAMTRHVYLLEGNKDEPAPTGRDMKPLKENRMLSLNLAGNGAHKASAEALLKRAAKMRRMGHWPEAQAAYRQLVNEYPTRAESKLALVSLGELCLERLSDPESALHWYARYRAETPKGPLVQEAMFGEIQALEKLGRKEDEQRLLEKFLKLFPRAVQAPAVKRRLEILPQDPRQ